MTIANLSLEASACSCRAALLCVRRLPTCTPHRTTACTLRPPLPADQRLLDGSNVGTPYVQWRPRIVNCRLRPSGRSACFLWGGGFLLVCRFEGAPLASLIGRPALLPCSTAAAFLTARRSYCTLHFLLLCIRLSLYTTARFRAAAVF